MTSLADELCNGFHLLDYDYDNRWAWEESEGTSKSKCDPSAKRLSEANAWLNSCLTAVSPPFGDIIAFARDRNLAVFRLKPDEGSPSKNVKRQCHLSCGTHLAGLAMDEKITAITCVPLVSQQKSNEGGVDWIAIVIGFNSGVLRVYTESGALILVQKLHDEPIKKLLCSTFYSAASNGKRAHPDDPEQQDEITVIFNSIVLIIEGFAFYQTVRSARNHLARLRTGEDAVRHVLDLGVTLPYRKWNFKSYEPSKLSDIANGGLRTTSLYDHFVSQSIKTHQGIPRKNKTLCNAILTTGDNPYVGFYQAFEDDSQTILSEMAQAMVSTVKNFIPLFGKRDEPKVDNPIPLRSRIGFYDQNREGLQISFSPDKVLAVVCDEFGRITLIDTVNWIAVRMWKGYRDAECGWLEVAEDETAATSKKSLLLLIYAPKRGIVEVWRCQKGPRIATFNVGKNCKLFYNNYSILGLNHILRLRAAKPLVSSCYLFDRSSGLLSTFDVPFVCSLTDKSSKIVRDNHLLKEFKLCMMNNDGQSSLAALSSVASIEGKKEALLHATSLDSVELIEKVAEFLKAQLLSNGTDKDVTALDYSSKLMVQMCCRILQLCRLFQGLIHTRYDPNVLICDFLKEPPNDIEKVAKSLFWKPVDVAKCISLFGLRLSIVGDTAVRKRIRTKLSISQFLSAFSLEQNQIVKNIEGKFLTSDIPVEVKWSQSKGDVEQFYDLARFMLEPIFSDRVNTFFDLYDKSVIKPSSLLKILYLMWLSPESYADHWQNWISFSFAVKTISSQLAEETEEDNLLSISWKSVCGLTMASKNLPSALIAGYVIKAITSELNIMKPSVDVEHEDPMSLGDNEWETLSLDEERLNLLLKQLEDTFLLDLLLKSDRSHEIDSQLSLSFLVKSNAGIVSELVAKWAVRASIQPNPLIALCDQASLDGHSTHRTIDLGIDVAMMQLKTNLDEETVEELLGHVRRCFPYSLESQVVLANCCWEALSVWDRSPSVANSKYLHQSLNYLNAITSAVLKHNIACLLWKTFVVKKLETLSILMQKMAKVPKDRICQKDLGMGENCLESFVQLAHDLLEIVMQNVRGAVFEASPIFTIDDWWKHRSDASSRSLPLVHLALNLKVSNAALVLEHTHLALVTMFMVSFQLKLVKPMSLFPSVVQQNFFKELHSTNFEPPLNDYLLNETRTKFLSSVVTAVAQAIPSFEVHLEEDQLGPDQTEHHSVANKWFGKALILSREWELPTDLIRRRFVSELYANSCDPLADEVYLINEANLF